jgi:hypothetical protein
MARTSNPSAVVVAIESWTTLDDRGNAVFVYRDSRWRADDPIVKRRPELFIEDGSTHGEILAARENAGLGHAPY